MILQLNPQIPILTPKGKAQAFAIVDYSEEHDLMFCCFLDEGGACWTFKNSEIRGFPNATMGRTGEKPLGEFVLQNYPERKPYDFRTAPTIISE